MGINTKEKKPNIYIRMFGDFYISFDGIVFNDFASKSKKVIALIEFLIVNRFKDISQENLYNVLWEENDKNINLSNALKNLVYRARTLLRETFGENSPEFILFKRDTYAWNTEIDCIIDIEEFERFLKEASDNQLDCNNRIELYLKAFSLYKGEFLAKSSSKYWILIKSTYFASVYIRNILEASVLFFKEKRYEEIITVCEIASEIYPFEEQIQIILLKAYAYAGRYKKALFYYNHVSKLLYKELGVKVSEPFHKIYKDILKHLNDIEPDINIIKSELKEIEDTVGAYLCDYEIFKNLYRIQSRTISRTGQTIYIALMTITEINGKEIDINLLSALMELLENTIINSLRKGDTISRYSTSQFILMLPLDSYENGEMVLNRILLKFKKINKFPTIKIVTKLQSIEPRI